MEQQFAQRFLNLLNLEPNDNILNSQFSEHFHIDSGSFGTVYKVRHRLDGKVYAVKKVEFEGINERERRRVLNEIITLERLNPDYVSQYYNSWSEGKHVYIHMEYCQQTLRHVLKDKRQAFGRQPKQAMNIYEYFLSCQILRELTECLDCIHGVSPPVIHRDIKPDNIFVVYNKKNDRFFKLGDFGLATDHEYENQSHSESTGTMGYMAKEVETSRCYTTKADVYSLGVVAAEIYDIFNVKPDVYNGSTFTTEYNKLCDILWKMIDSNENNRPTARVVLESYNGWNIDKEQIKNRKDFIETKNTLQSNYNSFFFHFLLFKTIN